MTTPMNVGLSILAVGLLGIGSVVWWQTRPVPVEVSDPVITVNYTPPKYGVSLTGEYVFEGSVGALNGSLNIKHIVGEETFLFDLQTFNGAHVGEMNGEAVIVGAQASSVLEDNCWVFFNLMDPVIEIKTSPECTTYKGVAGFLDGRYVKGGEIQELTLAKLGTVGGQKNQVFANQGEIDAFIEMVEEKNVHLFTDTMQEVNLLMRDQKLDARVYTGGITGLYSEMEGIIMIGPNQKMWAAALIGDRVSYFTNVAADVEKLPASFETWRSRFAGSHVFYMSK